MCVRTTALIPAASLCPCIFLSKTPARMTPGIPGFPSVLGMLFLGRRGVIEMRGEGRGQGSPGGASSGLGV